MSEYSKVNFFLMCLTTYDIEHRNISILQWLFIAVMEKEKENLGVSVL